jgi:hypothetical protein
MLTEVKKCDQCGEEIPEARRRLAFSGTLVVWNGHRSEVCRDLPHLCSDGCLINSVRTMLDDANTKHSPAAT